MSVQDIGVSSIETIEETFFSTIQRTKICLPSDPNSPTNARIRWIAIKSSTTHPRLSKEPHDIIKELQVLSNIQHPNIIPILGSELDNVKMKLRFWMPYIPYSLRNLLASTALSPHPLLSFSSPPTTTTPRETRFVLLVKSFMYQILCALAFLHNGRGIGQGVIAHRDIKPSNILLKPDGLVVLIDFGVAWVGKGEGVDVDQAIDASNLWPESEEKMYFEVATGPYRAPELLFGPLTYDAPSTDLWSLGAMFAEFFTSLRLSSSSASSSSSSSSTSQYSPTSKRKHDKTPKPFILPSGSNTTTVMNPSARWRRTTLFNAERGEIGLAWSIFRVRGTPDAENWPTFKDLPDASKVTFVSVPAVDLASLLPNLPPSTRPHLFPQMPSSSSPSSASTSTPTSHCPPPFREAFSTPFDLLHRLLVYPPHNRLRATYALRHPWFVAEPGVLLPGGYPAEWAGDDGEEGSPGGRVGAVWDGKPLGELMRACLPHRSADT